MASECGGVGCVGFIVVVGISDGFFLCRYIGRIACCVDIGVFKWSLKQTYDTGW